MDVSKVAYEIYKRLYEARERYGFELWPEEVLRRKDQWGLTGASLEDIREAFSWHKGKGVIDHRGGSERYTITSKGKETPPEYLIWEEQEERYRRLQERMERRKWWARGTQTWFFPFLLLLFFASISGIGLPDYSRYLLLAFAGLLVLLGVISSRRSGSPPPNEDLVFAKMWKAYQSFREYETEGKQESRKECVGKLNDAVKILRTEDRVSDWFLVDNTIFGSFHKLSRYIKDTMVPLLEGKAEKVGSQIVDIGALFLERDVSGLIRFVEGLDVKVPTEKRRIPSWGELTAKPMARFALAVIGFSVLTVLGFYGVSILQYQPLISYAHLMLGSWIAVVGAAAIKIFL